MRPCEYYDWDEAAARDRQMLPVNECQMQCGRCGFNPAVADLRLERIKKSWQSKNSNRRSGTSL